MLTDREKIKIRQNPSFWIDGDKFRSIKDLSNIRQLEMERAGNIITCGGLRWQQVENRALQEMRARKISKK